jgi:hypothetical protein
LWATELSQLRAELDEVGDQCLSARIEGNALPGLLQR